MYSLTIAPLQAASALAPPFPPPYDGASPPGSAEPPTTQFGLLAPANAREAGPPSTQKHLPPPFARLLGTGGLDLGYNGILSPIGFSAFMLEAPHFRYLILPASALTHSQTMAATLLIEPSPPRVNSLFINLAKSVLD